jgi:phosphate transport system substrate-binding protein
VDVINDLFNDSVRTIITTRRLSHEDSVFFHSKRQYPISTKIAYDALALIVNKNNTDSNLSSFAVKDIFKSKINNWKQINPQNHSGKIEVVFDNIKSGNVLYFKEKFKLDSILPENFKAANSNQEVISYIQSHPNAIGVLSVNWISDRADTVSQSFLKHIKVVGVSSEDDPENGYYYRPYQGYIADKTYPYIRDVYMICNESFYGLGSGFTQFVAGEKGQRIILKSKLVPATMPVRIVEFK